MSKLNLSDAILHDYSDSDYDWSEVKKQAEKIKKSGSTKTTFSQDIIKKELDKIRGISGLALLQIFDSGGISVEPWPMDIRIYNINSDVFKRLYLTDHSLSFRIPFYHLARLYVDADTGKAYYNKNKCVYSCMEINNYSPRSVHFFSERSHHMGNKHNISQSFSLCFNKTKDGSDNVLSDVSFKVKTSELNQSDFTEKYVWKVMKADEFLKGVCNEKGT